MTDRCIDRIVRFRGGAYMSGNNKRSDDGIITFVALIILAIVAMPLVGLYLIFKPNGSTLLGVLLVIIGVILWGMYLK